MGTRRTSRLGRPDHRRPPEAHGSHRKRQVRALRRHGRVHVLHGRPAARHAARVEAHWLDLPAL